MQLQYFERFFWVFWVGLGVFFAPIPTLDTMHFFAGLFAFFLLVSYSVLELWLLLVCQFKLFHCFGVSVDGGL